MYKHPYFIHDQEVAQLNKLYFVADVLWWWKVLCKLLYKSFYVLHCDLSARNKSSPKKQTTTEQQFRLEKNKPTLFLHDWRTISTSLIFVSLKTHFISVVAATVSIIRVSLNYSFDFGKGSTQHGHQQRVLSACIVINDNILNTNLFNFWKDRQQLLSLWIRNT